jgi:hypothetical protein
MVYSQKFVMSVLVNGVPQRELSNGCVPMDFGTEYALRLRNKNNRRAMVKLFIDGESIGGEGFLVNANDFVDIKRSVDKDAAFKFVSLESPDAVDFGKNGPNLDKIKGTIEARFYLEKEKPSYTFTPTIEHHHHHHYPRPKPQPYWPPLSNPYPHGTWTTNTTVGTSSGYSGPVTSKGSSAGGNIDNVLRSSSGIGGQRLRSSVSPCSAQSMNMNLLSQNSAESLSLSDGTVSCSVGDQPMTMEFRPAQSMPLNEQPPLQDGCTVEGTLTGQQFREVYFDAEDSFVSVKVFLQGKTGSEPKYVRSRRSVEQKPVELDRLRKENEELRLRLENAELQKRIREAEQA